MLEQVSGDGERRPVDPAMLAHVDQIEARFQDLTADILTIRAALKKAAMENDDATIGVLTRQLETTIRQEWPDATGPQLNYIMFLVHLVEQARAWTEHCYEAVDILMRQLAAVARPDHPLKAMSGFGQDALDSELAAVLAIMDDLAEGANSNTFTTASGVTLHNVHAADECVGQFCVVHNPAPGPWSNWGTHWREDWKLMVRVCPHGLHHVAIEEMLRTPLLGLIGHDHPGGCDCPCDFSRCVTITDGEGNIIGFKANG